MRIVIKKICEKTQEQIKNFASKINNNDIEFDETDVFAIVGSQEADPMQKRISDDSPFGKAMLGKHIGDVVEVEAPVGTIKFEILDVNR